MTTIKTKTLAALLHDIGKFYQRTGATIDPKSFDAMFMKDFGQYKHAAFTSKLISEHLPNLSFLVRESAAHHIENGIIATSDRLASAHDRKSDEEEDQLVEQGKFDYILKRMHSIFNEVTLSSKESISKKFVSIESLDQFALTDQEKEPNLVKAKEEYKRLFNQFVNAIKPLGKEDIKTIHHKLYPLIKQYTTSIPSATYQKDNPSYKASVSLFDHLKLTAAIASCLESCQYQYGKENQSIQFALLEYDLSGIQDYIYRVTEGEKTKGFISQSLRSRSFYLLLLTDFIGYYILHQFGLSYENLLFSAGGRGLILLPKGAEFDHKIETAIESIEESIYKKYKGRISFAIASNEVEMNRLEQAYDEIIDFHNKKVLISKKQKFKTLLKKTDFAFVKQPFNEVCELCETYEIQKNRRCIDCNQLLILNDLLKNQTLYIRYQYDQDNSMSDLSFTIGDLGSIDVLISKPLVKEHNYFVTINGHDLGEFKYYANHNANNKSFEQIAKLSVGDPKIAVLKMDVDNLGLIMGKGIPSEVKTFSKILTLSRTMDYFFTKTLSIIIKKQYQEKVYVNYAGGDDLVLIATASDILDINNIIVKEFSMFTSSNPNIHLSSGIEILNPKSPIRFAILQAEEYLHKSKQVDGKNSLTMLDVTISNSDLDFVIEEIKVFEQWMNQGKITRGMLYKLYSSILSSFDSTHPQDMFAKFIPQISYSIERNIKDDYVKEKLKQLFVKRDINVHTLKIYKIVIAFTLMKSRNNKEESL